MKYKYLAPVAGALMVTTALTGCANNASGPSGAASAPAANAANVTIMVGGLSKQIYLPFMLAKKLGYYDKIGVNVNLIDEPAGGDATQNMLAGQVQGVGGFYTTTSPSKPKTSRRSPSCPCCKSPARSSCAEATSREP